MTNHQNSESNIIKNSKQNSVYLGLQSVLTEQEANEVIDKWSTYFEGTDSVFNGLNNFAKEVCQTYGIAAQQRDLLRALHRALLIADSDSSVKVVKDTQDNNLALQPAVRSAPVTAIEAELATSRDIDNSEYTALITNQVINTPEFLTFQSLFIKTLALLEKFETDFNKKLNPFLTELTHSMPWSEGQQNQLLSLINTGKTVQFPYL